MFKYRKKNRVKELNNKRAKSLTLVRDSDASRTGLLGEYQFVVDCIKHNIFKPIDISSQSDFIICNISSMKYIRVQIKTTLKHKNRTSKSYGVTITRNNKEVNSYIANVDILAIYCVDYNTWYIIPMNRLKNRRMLSLTPSGEFADCIGFDNINKLVKE